METDYNKQAEMFLTQTGSTFKAEYVRHDLYFPSDTDKRDIYKITLTKGARTYEFEFGQSIAHSGEWKMDFNIRDYICGQCLSIEEHKKARGRLMGSGCGKFASRNKDFQAPSAYDVLACVEKHAPGTFEDFCGELGYDADSRTAEKIYNAVKEQFKQICMLYNDKELTALAEIQ